MFRLAQEAQELELREYEHKQTIEELQDMCKHLKTSFAEQHKKVCAWEYWLNANKQRRRPQNNSNPHT